MKARTVNAGLFMAFKYHISFATDFVANFGCDLFRIIPEIVEKNLESEQTPFFFGQIVHFDEIWSDVLHRTWFAKCILFLCFFFHPETNNKW